MITEMKWARFVDKADVLTCQSARGSKPTQFEFMCIGENIVSFRLRMTYGRRRFGQWSAWQSLDKVAGNEVWCNAVRMGVKLFRAEEAEYTY